MRKLYYQEEGLKIERLSGLVYNFIDLDHSENNNFEMIANDVVKSYENFKNSIFYNGQNILDFVDYVEYYIEVYISHKNHQLLIDLRDEQGVNYVSLNGFSEDINYVINLKLNDLQLSVAKLDIEDDNSELLFTTNY